MSNDAMLAAFKEWVEPISIEDNENWWLERLGLWKIAWDAGVKAGATERWHESVTPMKCGHPSVAFCEEWDVCAWCKEVSEACRWAALWKQTAKNYRQQWTKLSSHQACALNALQEALAQARAEGAREERERCAAVTCEHCADGTPRESGWHLLDRRAHDDDVRVRCKADYIWGGGDVE